jgi:hypothetical protein
MVSFPTSRPKILHTNDFSGTIWWVIYVNPPQTPLGETVASGVVSGFVPEPTGTSLGNNPSTGYPWNSLACFQIRSSE